MVVIFKPSGSRRYFTDPKELFEERDRSSEQLWETEGQSERMMSWGCGDGREGMEKASKGMKQW